MAAREGITRVAQRLDAVERLEFLAQAADEDVDGARVEVGILAAEAAQYLVAVEHLLRRACEQGEEFELGPGEVDQLAPARHLAAFEVDLQAVEDEPLRRCRGGPGAP